VLLDPGPDVADHVRALVAWVADADSVRVVLTHGHADHAGCARAVAEELGTGLHGPSTVEGVTVPLADGDEIATDVGTLVAVHTPGHTADHLSFHWRERNALFVGDLMLGKGDTTWVGEYPGCVADYLASLRRVRSLAPTVLYPAHGPPVEDVPAALDRYERHRRERIAQVAVELDQRPDATADELVLAVYGAGLASLVHRAAAMSLQALLDHVRAQSGC
jgi:glyoxylase-like metal-dependent hydrolase (beta-lactamase superfamily II)